MQFCWFCHLLFFFSKFLIYVMKVLKHKYFYCKFRGKRQIYQFNKHICSCVCDCLFCIKYVTNISYITYTYSLIRKLNREDFSGLSKAYSSPPPGEYKRKLNKNTVIEYAVNIINFNNNNLISVIIYFYKVILIIYFTSHLYFYFSEIIFCCYVI